MSEFINFIKKNFDEISNVLIVNNEKIAIEDIEYISSFVQNIYVILDNKFSYTRFFIKLRSLRNVHVINSDRIPNINYDVISIFSYGQNEKNIINLFKTIKYIFIEYNNMSEKIDEFNQITSFYYQKKNETLLNNEIKNQQNFEVDNNEETELLLDNNDETELYQIKNEIIANINSEELKIIPKSSNVIVRNSLKNYNNTYIKSYKNENKDKLKISIIIPTFNQSSFTIKCFKSINRYCEKNHDIEIYWVDNGSDIEEIEKVKDCIKKLIKIKVKEFFSKEKLGFVKATNWGIEEALKSNPDYIILQNNDTEVTFGWLSPMINALKSDNNIMARTAPLQIQKLQYKEI